MVAEDLNNNNINGISITTKKIRAIRRPSNLFDTIFDEGLMPPNAKRQKTTPNTKVIEIVDYPFIVACEYGDLNLIKNYLTKHNHHPHNNNIITNQVGLPIAFRKSRYFLSYDCTTLDYSFCGHTGLYYAAYNGVTPKDKSIVDYLMANGGNEMDKMKGYQDVFFNALIDADLDDVKYLLQNKLVNPNGRYKYGLCYDCNSHTNILHCLAMQNYLIDDMTAIEWFVNHHNMQGIINQADRENLTPLDHLYDCWWHCIPLDRYKEKRKFIQLLKENGAKRSIWGVVEHGDIEGLKELLMDKSTDIMQLDRDGNHILNRFMDYHDFDWLHRVANVSPLPVLQLLLDQPGIETFIKKPSGWYNILDKLLRCKGSCKVLVRDLDAAIALVKDKGAKRSLFNVLDDCYEHSDDIDVLKKMLKCNRSLTRSLL